MIARALEPLGDAIVGGEIVAVAGDGTPLGFQALQRHGDAAPWTPSPTLFRLGGSDRQAQGHALCVLDKEVGVGGFTQPRGSRVGIGALLIGYYDEPLETTATPFDTPVKPLPPGTHWVRPALVAQGGFAEWTAAGRMRQPRFLGLREDKAAGAAVRERPS